MAEKRITQEKVAAALGISQESVSRRVRGVQEWRISELHTVAGLLDASVVDLLDGATEPTARAS